MKLCADQSMQPNAPHERGAHSRVDNPNLQGLDRVHASSLRQSDSIGTFLWTDPPGWIAAVHAGVIQAQPVPVRIPQVSLPPQPGLIDRRRFKCDTSRSEFSKCPVKVRALEVHDRGGAAWTSGRQIQRERAAAHGAFKSRVLWQVTNDERKPERPVKVHRPFEIRRRQGNLVEVHRGNEVTVLSDARVARPAQDGGRAGHAPAPWLMPAARTRSQATVV
jgi:hypothetical protein